MKARYTITNIDNLLIAADSDTKNSRYPAIQWTGFRKFFTREDARAYKRARKHPQQYAIIDELTSHVVR